MGSYLGYLLKSFFTLRVPAFQFALGIVMNYDTGKNLQTVDIFSTTYLPRLVNVVCEVNPNPGGGHVILGGDNVPPWLR